jgi:hypothetical protein
VRLKYYRNNFCAAAVADGAAASHFSFNVFCSFFSHNGHCRIEMKQGESMIVTVA